MSTLTKDVASHVPAKGEATTQQTALPLLPLLPARGGKAPPCLPAAVPPEIVVDLFAGPGGWDEAARTLGMSHVTGVEIDVAACRTRAAAGHSTIRADVAQLPADRLAGKVRGLIGSPPCTTFSRAGDQAGNVITALLEDLTRDLFAGNDSREHYATVMRRELTQSEWATEFSETERAEKISAAVASACLVAEPARFVAACEPEWVTLEQVVAVLPLWRAYTSELKKMGYHAWCGILNAADYGVAQTRQRAILIASRGHKVHRPVATHYDARKGEQLWGEPWVSMAEALGWGATGRIAPTVTSGGTKTGGAEPFGHRDRDALTAEQEAGRWALRIDQQARASVRPVTAPALKFGHAADDCQWVLHTNRGQAEDGTRQTVDPSAAPAPAPALTAKSGGQWNVKTFRNNNNNNACERSVDEPAGTLFFGNRSNWAAWVTERPDTSTGNAGSASSRPTRCASPCRKPPSSSPSLRITRGRERRPLSSPRWATPSRRCSPCTSCLRPPASPSPST